MLGAARCRPRQSAAPDAATSCRHRDGRAPLWLSPSANRFEHHRFAAARGNRREPPSACGAAGGSRRQARQRTKKRRPDGAALAAARSCALEVVRLAAARSCSPAATSMSPAARSCRPTTPTCRPNVSASPPTSPASCRMLPSRITSTSRPGRSSIGSIRVNFRSRSTMPRPILLRSRCRSMR